jgi:hypothetical protein
MGCWKRGYYYSHGRYVGRGDLACLVELLDVEDWKQARQDRDQARKLNQEAIQGFHEARQIAGRIDRLVNLGLEAAGFHRHARGPWRRRKTMEVTLQLPASKPSSKVTKRIGDLCRRLVKRDDPNALDELRRLGEEHPETLVEEAHGDLGKVIEGFFLANQFRVAPSLIAGVEAKLRLLRAELAGPDPTPALRLAVEAAAYRWLDHWSLEISVATRPGTACPALDRRRNWAHRRYLQALAAVERIRRLTRPSGPRVAVQIVQNGPVPPLDLTQSSLIDQ